MEPTLTPPDPTDDSLDALLRAAPPVIPDDGFTARVCAALPPRDSAMPSRVRWAMLAGPAALGCALAWWILSHTEPGLGQKLAAAVSGWTTEPWEILAMVFIAAIWGLLALNHNETEAGTLARR